MNHRIFTVLAVFGTLGGWAGELEQPIAKPKPTTTVYHGTTVEDDYLWLEDTASDQVQQWVLGQDAYARRQLAKFPHRSLIKKRLQTVGQTTRYIRPFKAGDRFFYQENRPGINSGNLWMEQPNGRKTKVLDVADLPDKMELRGTWPSPDGQKLAYALNKIGTRWGSIYIKNIEDPDRSSGQKFTESIEGYHTSFTTVTWRKDSLGFFYNSVEPESTEEGASQDPMPRGLFFHKLGTPQSKDKPVFQLPNQKEWLMTHSMSEDGRFLVIQGRNQDLRKAWLAEAPFQTTREIFKVKGSISFLGAHGRELFFLNHEDAERGQITAFDFENFEKKRTVISEHKDTLVSGTMENGLMVLTYRKDALPELRAFHADGRPAFEIDLPKIASPGVSRGQSGDGEMFVRLSNLTDPGSIWRLSLKTGRFEEIKAAKTNHDPDQFTTRQVFFQSKDGTRIPMFLVHKKDLVANGENPVLMYGYGAGNWAAFPWYQTHMQVWLEMGGVYAMPNIRGGGEYGRLWAEAGMKHKKQNAIDDFIAAGRWLIESGITSSKKLIGNGGSASGPLIGAAMIQAPDLFGAALIEWPALDMLRFHQYPGGRYWTWGNGTPEDPDDFRVLRTWSPYHNINAGTCYPPTLMIVGEKDQGTIPAHAYKFQAALQKANACQNPILMRMVWSGRHYQYGKNTADSQETWADILSFLGKTTGLEEIPFSAAGQ